MSTQPKPIAEQAIRFLYAATEAVQMTPEQRREVLAAYDFAIKSDRDQAATIREYETRQARESAQS